MAAVFERPRVEIGEYFHRKTLAIVEVLDVEHDNFGPVRILCSLQGELRDGREVGFCRDAENFVADYVRNEPVTISALERAGFRDLWAGTEEEGLYHIQLGEHEWTILYEQGEGLTASHLSGRPIPLPKTYRDVLAAIRVIGGTEIPSASER